MVFKPGESGNPSGKPKGAISGRTQLSKLLEPHAEELVAKVVELAKAGDMNALRFILERLIPKPKEETVNLDFPEEALNKPAVLLEFSTQILNATIEGGIAPEQAQKLFNVVKLQSEVIVLAELEGRMESIEKTLKERLKT